MSYVTEACNTISNPVYSYFQRTSANPEDYIVFEVNYDGVFKELPLRYDYGRVLTLKLSKFNKMSMCTMLDMLSYKLETHIWSLYYCTPRSSLQQGLTLVESEDDMKKMYYTGIGYGLINLYIAHSPCNLAAYYFKNLTLDGAVPEMVSELRRHERLMLDAHSMTFAQLKSWEEEQDRAGYLRTPPATPRRKGCMFPCENLFGDYLHSDSVADHFDIQYERRDEENYDGMCFDADGYGTGCQWLSEQRCIDNMSYTRTSLPDEFEKEVVFADIGESPLAKLLKNKCRTRVKPGRKKSFSVKRSTILKLRRGQGKRVSIAANEREGNLINLFDDAADEEEELTNKPEERVDTPMKAATGIE